TVPLDEAPQLPAPTGLAQVAGAVKAAAADERTGVILVQRVTGPDGATSWLVAIPGTQSGGFGGDTVTDMSTNLALDGGLPDQMTSAVLDAMAQAGIRPDDPVVLAGHSQGGMTAQSVAVAAGTAYSIRSVVTFGSPTIPQPMPSGVRLFALEQQQEAVNGLDGAAGTRTAPGVVVIRGDAATAATGPTPGPVAAHSMDGYAALARKADEAFAAADRQVPGLPVADSGPVTDSGDGGAGGGAASGAVGSAVQVTTQAFQATRDPAVVTATVPTMSAAP
ncbi:GPI inositol-deacylase, partial [Cellulomonas citrea]|uniref:GPI inositol-deacylase n=1 Tax=Cellulomonas citrea TaxID=1909423 RepID=UPI001F3FBD0A